MNAARTVSAREANHVASAGLSSSRALPSIDLSIAYRYAVADTRRSSGALPPAGEASGDTQSPSRALLTIPAVLVSNSRSTYFFMPS